MHKARIYPPAVRINAQVYIASQGDISVEHLASQWFSVQLEQWTLVSAHPTPYGYISIIRTLKFPPRCFLEGGKFLICFVWALLADFTH